MENNSSCLSAKKRDKALHVVALQLLHGPWNGLYEPKQSIEAMSRMKTADYRYFGGPVIEYDADAPCWSCDLPVESASMGGTVICSWCDCGMKRDGVRWTMEECVAAGQRYAEKRRIQVLGGCSDATS